MTLYCKIGYNSSGYQICKGALHKVTKKLSENQTIAVENLMIKNMSKKAKGWPQIHFSKVFLLWGHISKENRQTQAKFICTKCHTTLNADYNASVNILNAVGTTVKAS